MSELLLYQLVGKDDRLISPHCIRVKMALAHLGVNYKINSVKLSEKTEKLPFEGTLQLPILVDGDRVLTDSWQIVNYLERNFVESPTLLGGQYGAAHARFINSWVDCILDLEILFLIIKDIYNNLDEESKPLFRKTREEMFGQTLEEIQENRELMVIGFRKSLVPLRVTLKNQPFFSGEVPGYADYIIFSSFYWAQGLSRFSLLEDSDPLYNWKLEMQDIYLKLRNS